MTKKEKWSQVDNLKPNSTEHLTINITSFWRRHLVFPSLCTMGTTQHKIMLVSSIIVVETRTPRQILSILLNTLQFSFVS